MSDAAVIITTTNADKNTKEIIDALLEAKLAACIQCMPITSAYVWNEKIQNDQETILLIKSRASLFEEIENTIKSVHSYDEPEIIMLDVSDGSAGYLSWILSSTKSN